MTTSEEELELKTAQIYDKILRGRQITYMIYDHFRATGAHDAVHGLSDLFSVLLQNGVVQDFDVRWDQALLSAKDEPSDVFVEGL